MNVEIFSSKMSSKRIAERTGKEHKNVIRDIRSMVASIKECPDSSYKEVKDLRRYCSEIYLNEYLFNLLLDKYSGLLRVPNRAQEEAALKTIEQLLGVKLIRQYLVLRYRIDGYDKENNIAYEIDEPQHTSVRAMLSDEKREIAIKKVLGCRFVRIRL